MREKERKMDPHLQNLKATSTVVSQVAETIRTGSAPIWTPQLSVACQLTLVSLRTHAAIAPHHEEARHILASWPSQSLAAVIVDTQDWMLGRLVLFLPVRDSLEWWCTTKGRPAYTFCSGWELLHTVSTAMAEPAFPRASNLVEDYAFHVETHLAAWQVALPRISGPGAAVLHLTGSKSRLEDPALALLLHYMPKQAKVDRLPAAWAGSDQRSRRKRVKGPMGLGLSDASQEHLGHLWELLVPIRDLPVTERLVRALDRKDDYVPRDAGRDFLNRLKVYRDREATALEEPFLPEGEDEDSSAEAYAERHRRGTDPGGKDPSIWTPGETRQALGGFPALERLRDFCMNPQGPFLESLPAAELAAFHAVRRAVMTHEIPPRRDLVHALAEAAEVSPATVSRLLKRIRALL
jgi:hypothetical protein